VVNKCSSAVPLSSDVENLSRLECRNLSDRRERGGSCSGGRTW